MNTLRSFFFLSSSESLLVVPVSPSPASLASSLLSSTVLFSLCEESFDSLDVLSRSNDNIALLCVSLDLDIEDGHLAIAG